MSFDLKTDHRDKNGRIKRQTPYKLIVRNGQQIFVRDGVEYYPNGEKVQKEAPAAPAPAPVEIMKQETVVELEIEEKEEKKDGSKNKKS